jgi:hypothetical protein
VPSRATLRTLRLAEHFFSFGPLLHRQDGGCKVDRGSQHHTQARMRKVYVKLLERWCELVNEEEAKP